MEPSELTKIDRQVLEAIKILTEDSTQSGVSQDKILTQIKCQIKNLVPASNLEILVQESVRKLTDGGLVNRFAPEPPLFVSTSSTQQHSVTYRKRSFSQLDPNKSRTRCVSEESLSGDEFERTRKRLRSNNKKLRFLGRPVPPAKKREQLKYSQPFIRKLNKRTPGSIKPMITTENSIFIDDDVLKEGEPNKNSSVTKDDDV